MANKITKREIKEELDSIPMDKLLLGKARDRTFTAKQKKFAKGVALGKTLSDSYRDAYDTEGKPAIVNSEASKLASNPKISQLIDAYSEAIEAQKYRTPAQLRALVIHQLTKHAINEDISTRDRLSALKMLGTVAEVGAFVERKESLVVHESGKIKAQLIDQLKTIIGKDMGGEVREVAELSEGEKLLAKLSRGKPSESVEPEPHPVGSPPFDHALGGNTLHNIPLKESHLSESSKNPLPQDVDLKGEKDEGGNVSTSDVEKEGVPSVKNGEVDWVEKPAEGPPSVFGSPE